MQQLVFELHWLYFQAQKLIFFFLPVAAAVPSGGDVPDILFFVSCRIQSAVQHLETFGFSAQIWSKVWRVGPKFGCNAWICNDPTNKQQLLFITEVLNVELVVIVTGSGGASSGCSVLSSSSSSWVSLYYLSWLGLTLQTHRRCCAVCPVSLAMLAGL